MDNFLVLLMDQMLPFSRIIVHNLIDWWIKFVFLFVIVLYNSYTLWLIIDLYKIFGSIIDYSLKVCLF